MKRCPQCNKVYENDVSYCLDDGSGLVTETFVLPSEGSDFEAETIIRHDPIVVDLSARKCAARNGRFSKKRRSKPSLLKNLLKDEIRQFFSFSV